MIVRTKVTEVEIGNAVAEAVYLVFGGIPQASKALGIVAQGVRNTLSEGKVATRANAERWEAATAKAGCKIPREELIGWAEWRGAERQGEGGNAKGPKASRPRAAAAGSRRVALEAVPTALTLSVRQGSVVRPRKDGTMPGPVCFQHDSDQIAA